MSVFSDKTKALHQEFSTFLRGMRKDVSYTMRDLSSKLGTPHSFIGKIENQHRRIDIAEFVYYCEGMSKDPRQTFDQMLKKVGK